MSHRLVSKFGECWFASSMMFVVCMSFTLFGVPGYACCQDSEGEKEALVLKLADDSKLLDGLRRRRLFDVAEFHCQELLADPKVDPTTQASITIQWMKTRSGKSVFVNPSERETTWKSVTQISSDFSKSYPSHPRRFLVEVQQALSHIAHSRLIQQEIEADMATENSRVDALEEIKSARSLLTRLQREIATAIPAQLRKSLTQHDLTSEQLMNLNNNVGFQLVICNLNRAQLYEKSDRLNRMDALNSVVQRLKEVQRTTSTGLPLWWKTKFSQIECLRLLNNPKAAQQLSLALPRNDASLEQKQQLLEQMIHVAIDLGDEAFSSDLLTEVEKLDDPSPQVDLATLELVAEQAARARTEARKQEWMTFAVKHAQSIEQRHGGYWGRRADLVLIRTTGGEVAGGEALIAQPKFTPANSGSNTESENVELEMLKRLADEALRKKRFDDAYKAYDRASKLAVSLGESEQALEADLQASLILEQQKKHELAANRLTESAERDPSLELAPSVHLRGCWNFSQILQNDDAKSGQYERLLNSHLKRWSDATTSDQARIYLARFYQAQNSLEPALNTYLKVSTQSPLFAQAIKQTESLANQFLADRRRAKFNQVYGLLDGVRQQLSPNDPNSIELSLIQVELDIMFGSSTPNADLASSLSSISNGENQTLVDRATALHAVSVCIDSPQVAIQLVSKLASNEKELSRCDRCLASIQQFSSLENAEALSVGKTRLAVVENALSIPTMSNAENSARQTSWMLRQAEVLTGLNRHQDALNVLTELEQRFPRNAGVQMQIARAMSIQYGDSQPKKAINKWGVIANRLKPYSENWLEAKFEIANLVLKSGDAERALKLLKYVKLNPPGWSGTKWEPKFESLLKLAKSKQ
jgi:hypothetical protein